MSSNKVKAGDHVLHYGKEVYVSEVMSQGVNDRRLKRGSVKKGEKAYICVCPIMPDNGQVLHRSPICIGTDWEHLPSATIRGVTSER